MSFAFTAPAAQKGAKLTFTLQSTAHKPKAYGTGKLVGKRVTVKLNAAGKQALAKTHKLKVALVVTAVGANGRATRTVTATIRR